MQGLGVNDGQWHMVSLSTHPDASPGYVLYLDGLLAADLNSTSRDPYGNPVQVVISKALHPGAGPCF